MPDKPYNRLKRLYLMVNQLRRSPASKTELMDLLAEHGLPVEVATFERDKKMLKDDFSLDLVYDSSSKKYRFEEVDTNEIVQLIQFLQYNQLSQALSANLSSSQKILDFIDFENEQLLKGIEHLHELIVATKNRQKIQFKHYSFQSGKTFTISLKPYLIKQFQSRWYVVGQTSYNRLRTFGIDRISDLVVTSKTFSAPKEDVKELFNGCIGVSEHWKEKELIQIAFHISQEPYLTHLPLHGSQTLVEKTENEITYEYFLVNNFELRQSILKYGELARVVKPKKLAEMIKNLKVFG